MRLRGQLNFGANLGFDYRYCTGCQEERLHRFGRCVSWERCQTLESQTLRQKRWAPEPGQLNRHQRKLLQHIDVIPLEMLWKCKK